MYIRFLQIFDTDTQSEDQTRNQTKVFIGYMWQLGYLLWEYIYIAFKILNCNLSYEWKVLRINYCTLSNKQSCQNSNN